MVPITVSRRLHITLEDDVLEYLRAIADDPDYPGNSKFISEAIRSLMEQDEHYEPPDAITLRLQELERRRRQKQKEQAALDAALSPDAKRIKARRILSMDPSVEGALRAYKLGLGLREIREMLPKEDYRKVREIIRRGGL